MSDFSQLRRLWSITLRQHRGKVIWVCILQLAYVPISLAQPVPLRVLVDNVIGGAALPSILQHLLPWGLEQWQGALLTLAVLTVSVSIVTQLHNVTAWMQATKLEQQAAFAFRVRLFEHVQRTPLNHLEVHGTSDAIYRISQDAESAKELTVGFTRYLVALGSIVGYAFVMLSINPLMTGVALAPVPVAFLLLATQTGRIRNNWARSFTLSNEAFNKLGESLALTRLVRVFGREGRQAAAYRSLAKASIHRTVAASRAEATLDALTGITFALGQAAVLTAGVMDIRSGALTLGELLVFHAYSAQMYAPLGTLSRMMGSIQQSLEMSNRALQLLDLPVNGDGAARTRQVGRARGRVELQSVTYTYPSGSGRPVLERFSLEVPAGTSLGITGPSGCGKSTLLDIIVGLVEPSAGRVLLDGIDIRQIDLNDLRRQFTMMSQVPLLFSASIAENVRYGRRWASDTEVRDALIQAGAWDFVTSLENGVDSVVGERGSALSGGERQRIALAQALLSDAPVLVMDEPTSALDEATELDVARAVLDGPHRRSLHTAIVVSHSRAVLDLCDSVMTMTPRDGDVRRDDVSELERR